MKVSIAYAMVVLIWSTTPLAIHWSNSRLSFITAITLRMVLALVVCYCALWMLRKPLIEHRREWRVFAIGAFGLFPNMLLVYWAAQSLSSGLMSVIMGLYPFFVGAFTWIFFRENAFKPAKFCAVLIAVIGLMVIHSGQLQLGAQAALGVLAMVLVCVFWGLSSVWVKRLGQDIDPLRLGTGSLVVAAPLFAITWWIIDGRLPVDVDVKSWVGVAYLVLAGSLLGHTLFFYILRHCAVVSVSLITLIAPVLAIVWGVWIEGEALTRHTLFGGGSILTSLFIFQGLHREGWRWLRSAIKKARDKKGIVATKPAKVTQY